MVGEGVWRAGGALGHHAGDDGSYDAQDVFWGAGAALGGPGLVCWTGLDTFCGILHPPGPKSDPINPKPSDRF